MARRKGISPVIGEFMVMVCAIVIGLPMIGFTFGTIGDFTHPAQVTVASSACGANGDDNGTRCTFSLLNVGAGNTQTVPTVIIYVSHGNITRTSVTHACNNGTPSTIQASAQTSLTCFFSTEPGLAGDQYSGSIYLSNGASVPFVGRF